MMKTLLFLGLLFFVLSPGILLTLPRGGSKMVVAATHALVFVTVWYFTRRFVVESFEDEDEYEYEDEYEDEEEPFRRYVPNRRSPPPRSPPPRVNVSRMFRFF
jgi:hypothetical protein